MNSVLIQSYSVNPDSGDVIISSYLVFGANRTYTQFTVKESDLAATAEAAGREVWSDEDIIQATATYFSAPLENVNLGNKAATGTEATA